MMNLKGSKKVMGGNRKRREREDDEGVKGQVGMRDEGGVREGRGDELEV